MHVTIIGTGNMARGIGSRVLAGGHDLTVIGKDDEAAKAVVADIGGNPGDRVEGDIVVLAVYYPDARSIAEQRADELVGKVVVDITNPVNETYDDLVVPPDSSATAELAALAPEARFVKAFNTTFATTLREGEVSGQQARRPDRGRRRSGQGLGRGPRARRRAQPDRRRAAEAGSRARGARAAPHGRAGHARHRLLERGEDHRRLAP